MTEDGHAATAEGADDWSRRHPQQHLRRILIRWDPIGVADVPQCAEEYDCVMPILTRMMRDGATQQDVSSWLQRELTTHFGLDPQPGREEAAARAIVVWGTSGGVAPTR